MLVRLTPDQISAQWSTLSQAIINSFEYMPEATPNPREILEMLMEMRLLCWVNIPKGGEKVNAVLTTAEVTNAPFRTKSLLIFSLWASMIGEGVGEWELGLETLRQYAKEHFYTDVIMFTRTPSVKAFLGRKAKHKDFFYMRA